MERVAVVTTVIDRAPDGFGCPKCGELDTDRLEWVSDSEIVCNVCGALYEIEDPAEAAYLAEADKFYADRIDPEDIRETGEGMLSTLKW